MVSACAAIEICTTRWDRTSALAATKACHDKGLRASCGKVSGWRSVNQPMTKSAKAT